MKKKTSKYIKNKEYVFGIIGTTNLCIQCIDHLISRNFSISFIVSVDDTLKKTALKRAIPYYSNFSCITDRNLAVDYLFSIINPFIIPDKILKNFVNLRAFNYHYSLLPKYAGMNSTTWAILNNEKYHGISWHEISSGIDEGNIFKQVKIPIGKNETALSLNVKCANAAYNSFKELVVDIIDNKNLNPIIQNLNERTYYRTDFILPNFGIIKYSDSYLYVDRLIRSVTFGELYDNLVGTVKIILNNSVYIVKKSEIKKQKKTNLQNEQN